MYEIDLYKTLKYLFLVYLIGLSWFSIAQNETKKWYFGAYAGLDFITSPPTILTNGALLSNEGCASIADASGNLLFYTDGATIWDKTHSIMPNGSGLTGNSNTTQSALIVKQPGNVNLYYVFTLAPQVSGGLSYSIIDINLAAGNGSVIAKNYSLTSFSTEKLVGQRH